MYIWVVEVLECPLWKCPSNLQDCGQSWKQWWNYLIRNSHLVEKRVNIDPWVRVCYRSTRLTIRDVTLSPLRSHPIGSFFLWGGVTTPIVSADEDISRMNECHILCRNASHVHYVDRIVSEKRWLQKMLQMVCTTKSRRHLLWLYTSLLSFEAFYTGFDLRG